MTRGRLAWGVVILALVGAAALLLRGAAPGRGAASPALVPPAPASLVLTDGLGRTVRLPGVPRRLISLGPSVTEVLFSLGVGDRVVGVTRNCNYPREALSLPKVGDLPLDYEKIIALAPDLCVGESLLNPEAIRKLESLGVPVLALRSDTLEDFRSSFLLVARAVGRMKRGRDEMARFDRRVEAVRRAVARVPRNRRPRVFVEIWDSPLMTAGPGTLLHQLVETAGGINVASDLPPGYGPISQEALLARNPQVILLSTSTVSQARSRSVWASLEAVRLGRVYRVDPDILSRPTLRMARALEVIHRDLYPEERL